MKIRDLAAGLPPHLTYDQLPDNVELAAALSLHIRSMAVTSMCANCETSAALKSNVSAPAVPDGPILAFSGAAVNDQTHAAVDVSEIEPPWQFYGTFHTHVDCVTSVTISTASVDGFAGMIQRTDGAPTMLVDNTAQEIVSPLAYSIVDIMTMIDAREQMAFLFCLPRTLYQLVRTADSAQDVQKLYRDCSAPASTWSMAKCSRRRSISAATMSSISSWTNWVTYSHRRAFCSLPFWRCCCDTASESPPPTWTSRASRRHRSGPRWNRTS